MTDIVERLRNRRGTITSLCDNAADEIERLRATLKKAEAVLLEGGELLKQAMAEIKRWSNWAIDYACDDTKCECDRCEAVRKAWDETQRNR